MLKSEQLRHIQDFILKCKRSDLEKLLKATNLPRSGLKHVIQSRLISYLEKDSPTKLLNAVDELRNGQNNVAHIVEKPRQSSVVTSSTPYPSRGSDGNSPSSCAKCSATNRSLCNLDSTSVSSIDFSPLDLPHPSVAPGPSITLAGAKGCIRLPATIPEFRFRESPFFKQIDVLIQPQVMVPSNAPLATDRRSCDRVLILRFTPDQTETIFYHCRSKPDGPTDFGVQVVMRFARLSPELCQKLSHRFTDTAPPQSAWESVDDMEDSLPIHLSIVVNGHTVQLPALLPSSRSGTDGRRNPRPINITQFLLVSPAMPNYINLTWTHDYSTCVYNLVAVYLMHKRSPQQLCSTLRTDAFRSADKIKDELVCKLQPPSSMTTTCDAVPTTTASSTTSLNECLSGDDDDDDDVIICSTMSAQLLCPLSKCRISIPVRGNACNHIQCFDATTYLIMNEQKPAWNCPVCTKKAYYEDLFVDGLFLQILNSPRSQDLEEVVFHSDGSWAAMEKSPVSDAVDSDDAATNEKVEFYNVPSSSQPHFNSYRSGADVPRNPCETEPVTRSLCRSRVGSPLCLSNTTRLDNQTRAVVDPQSSSVSVQQASSSCAAITIDLTGSDDDVAGPNLATTEEECRLVEATKSFDSSDCQPHLLIEDSAITASSSPAKKHTKCDRPPIKNVPYPIRLEDRLGPDRPRSHRVTDAPYSRHSNQYRPRPNNRRPNCPLSFGPPHDNSCYPHFGCHVGEFVPKDVGSNNRWHTFCATGFPSSHPCRNNSTIASSTRYRQADIQPLQHDLVVTYHRDSSWCDRRSRHVPAHLPPTARHRDPRKSYHP